MINKLKLLVLFILIFIVSSSVFAKNENKRFVNIKWNKTENISSYFLEISNDKDFKKIILSKQLKDSNYKWEEPPVGLYYFRVAVIDKYGQKSEFSNPGELNVVPQTPKIDEDASKNNATELVWKNYTSDVTSEIEIASDNEFKKIIKKKRIKDNSYKITGFENGEYYWRVKFLGKNNQESSFSSVGTFKIESNKVELKEPSKTEAIASNKHFHFDLGFGYSSLQVIQHPAVQDNNFLNMTGNDNKLGSYLFSGEWYPKSIDHWFSLAVDYNYSSIKKNFLSGSDKLGIHRFGIVTQFRYSFGQMSLIACLGYKMLPVFFIKSDGNTYKDNRNYILEALYLKYKPNSLPLSFKTGIQFSTYPTNVMLMPIFETFYLFQKWSLGFRFHYQRSSIPIDIINTNTQTVIASGSDLNKEIALYLIIGFEL